MPANQFVHLLTLERLGVALAIGLLIGLERGWERREQAEGSRSAGLRTFGIVGLLGGVAQQFAMLWLLAALALVVGALAALGYWRESQRDQDLSITTGVCTLLTLCLGAIAGAGDLTVAASASVVVALLLSFKPELHQMLRHIDQAELRATLRLLLISVVVLPALPNRGFGPWLALNPYKLWWMVVLVASLSYVGYFANRLLGERRGVLLTSLFGGLVSATALTLNLSRRAREESGGELDLLAAGVAIAGAIMLPRMLLIIGFIDSAVGLKVAGPLLAGAAASLVAALWFNRQGFSSSEREGPPPADLGNPLGLATALEFGLILAVITFISRAATALVGEQGLYVVAGLAGLIDVDAISLSVASMALQGIVGTETAVKALLTAALVNILLRPILASAVGNTPIAKRLAVVVLATISGGCVGFLILR